MSRKHPRLSQQELIELWNGGMKSRFMSKVRAFDDGCWVWIYGKTGSGYGAFHAGGNQYSAHRISYLGNRGVIPDGLELDHLCRNRACVNPLHLEAVVHRVNSHRGEGPAAENVKKTHCPKGHPYSEENTQRKNGGTRRSCRECARVYARNRLNANKSNPDWVAHKNAVRKAWRHKLKLIQKS